MYRLRQYDSYMNRSTLLVCASLFGVTQLACAGPLKYQVQSSELAPGADAKIEARVMKGQHSTEIDIRAAHLPPPTRVADKAVTYVIWQRKDSNQTWSRVGALSYDEEKLEGSFSGTIPEVAFDLSINAEKRVDVVSPSADVVFAQRVSR